MRLDVLLVKKALFESREKASFAIKSGIIRVNGQLANKPSQCVDELSELHIETQKALKYISLGGLKLEKAILDFGLDFQHKKVLDVGASTGGFTDCALQHGADLVWAVDVGTNQLHPSLRQNEKVHLIENIHIKDLTCEMMHSVLFDFIVADLSFISLGQVFTFFPKFLQNQGQAVVLIKPQFEAGRQWIGKNGIVNNEKVHLRIWNEIVASAGSCGLFLHKAGFSPIRDKNKNIEYLALFALQPAKMPDLREITCRAFEELKQLRSGKE